MKNYIYRKVINSHIPLTWRLWFLNYLLKWFGWPIKVQENNGYLLIDGEQKLYISRFERLYLYRKGINSRFTKYFDDYHLSFVDITEGSQIIDIGANIGELFVLLSVKSRIKYFGIEPDPKEYEVLVKNATSGDLSNCALYSSSGTMKFYSSNNTGDSSLIQNTESPLITEVPTMKLSDFIDGKVSGTIKLIKLEAEGCEYDILSVLEDRHFARIEYISADLGCERGIENESTLMPVVNLLLKKDFRILAFNPKRLTVLFVNTNIAG